MKMFAKGKDFFNKAKVKFISIIDKSKGFVEDTKNKFQNLYQTNYNTGIYHLEHGNLWDATFRFKIIKRFWPNKLEAQYQYAICLILQGMNGDAKRLLEDIIKKDSNYTAAKELLDKINNGDTEKMVKDFNVKFNKKDGNSK